MQRAFSQIMWEGEAAQQFKHRLTTQLFHAKLCLPIYPSKAFAPLTNVIHC